MIIAIQKAAAAPLELQRKSYYQFVEDAVRIMVDMIRNYYGVRYLPAPDTGTGMQAYAQVDFSQFVHAYKMTTVNVGASAYWSELTQVQTADNLLANGLVDGVTYIEAIPDNYLKNKKKVLEYNQQLKMQQEMQADAPATGGPAPGSIPSARQV